VASRRSFVYLARDPELARDIALKLVRPRHGTAATLARRLRREAQAMAKRDLLRRMKECGAALAVLEPTLAAAPPEGGLWIPSARWTVGVCLYEQGRRAEAVETFARAYAEAKAKGDVSQAAQVRYTRAQVVYELGREDEGRAEVRGAIAELPAEATQLRGVFEDWLARHQPRRRRP